MLASVSMRFSAWIKIQAFRVLKKHNESLAINFFIEKKSFKELCQD